MRGSDGVQVKVLRATGQRGVMTLDQSLSREIKVVDTTSLLGLEGVALEGVALEVGLSQRLPVGWVVENAGWGCGGLKGPSGHGGLLSSRGSGGGCWEGYADCCSLGRGGEQFCAAAVGGGYGGDDGEA